MKKCIIIIMFIILCAVGIFLYLLFRPPDAPVFYPTRSSPRELKLVLYGGFIQNGPVIVTLRHHVDGRHVADYVLVIENGLDVQEPQTYSLPELHEGTVEAVVEMDYETGAGDIVNFNFTVVYSDAARLYKKGLLVYFFNDFSSDYHYMEYVYYRDRYVHFKSGNDRICFFGDAQYGYLTEWTPVSKAPRLRIIPRDERPYWPTYSGWRENEWVFVEIP